MTRKDYEALGLITALLEDKPASIFCKSGRINAYRRAFALGHGASPSDPTFDPKLGARGGQKCCGSRVWWRHKVNCKKAVRNAPDDLSDLKDL